MAAALAACSGREDDEPEPRACPRATGPIVTIEPPGGPVERFVVERATGSPRFSIDPARDYVFDLNHLFEHLRTGDPVAVTCRDEDEGEGATAMDILDA